MPGALSKRLPPPTEMRTQDWAWAPRRTKDSVQILLMDKVTLDPDKT